MIHEILPDALREQAFQARRMFDVALELKPLNGAVVTVCLERLEIAVARIVVNGDVPLGEALAGLDKAVGYGLNKVGARPGKSRNEDLRGFLVASRLLYSSLANIAGTSEAEAREAFTIWAFSSDRSSQPRPDQ